MKRTIPVLILLILLNAGCESRGDKFPHFKIQEKLLGQIRNHEIKKASFINLQKGFVAVSKDTILKTTDSCKTFSLSLADKSAWFEHIQFVNDSVGFVIDRNNKIYNTLDGGNSWNKTYISVPGAVLLDIACISHDIVFIVAGGNPKSQKGYIIQSSDGGRSWISTASINLMNIHFIDDSTGFASGYGGIIKTTDGGKTWDTLSSLPATDLFFFDHEKGYYSYGRSLFKTVDGGNNWKLVRTIINPHWIVGEDFSKIEGLNRLQGNNLIFTLNARIFKITPNEKWFQYEFTRPYYQLQMISDDKGIAYGFENLILVQF
jgi:photosystem II stability/assembly factor-like uncharacterized protein